MKYSIINEDGLVINTAAADAEYAESQGWIAGGSKGDYWNGERFLDPMAKALDLLGTRRVEAEHNFTWNSISINLDEATQARIGAAEAGLSRQIEGSTIKWQTSPETFVEMDLTTLQSLGDAAFLHVQACFANAKALTILILDDENNQNPMAPITPANIDIDTGWP